ncbi:hypothetical protein TNCV_3020291 [Trichonephila clavipes]|nr:hypothetical protein TNCV_3020291 [Trichonephila clavipes]
MSELLSLEQVLHTRRETTLKRTESSPLTRSQSVAYAKRSIRPASWVAPKKGRKGENHQQKYYQTHQGRR